MSTHRTRRALLRSTGALLALASMLHGCIAARSGGPSELDVRDSIQQYTVQRTSGADAVDAATEPGERLELSLLTFALPSATTGQHDAATPLFTLGTFALDERMPAAQTRPADTRPARTPASAPSAFTPPEGYWRATVWNQMGREALDLGEREFWLGYKHAFWNLENALVLTATMGASIAIRGTGVDTSIADKFNHNQQLSPFMDESLQILGNPGTHFAAAGLVWLGSALTQDMKSHEFARTLVNALAVNGLTTVVLKVSTNTSSPDGDRYGWPSGHTSSAFTFAAVVNEYYGPWVGIPSLALAGFCGYQRLDSRVHDFSDVVFGAMLGYVVGSSIARHDKARFPEIWGMQILPYHDPETGTSGLALYKSWK